MRVPAAGVAVGVPPEGVGEGVPAPKAPLPVAAAVAERAPLPAALPLPHAVPDAVLPPAPLPLAESVGVGEPPVGVPEGLPRALPLPLGGAECERVTEPHALSLPVAATPLPLAEGVG